MLLTAEDLDTGSMQVVLSSYQRPHTNDQDVTKASNESHKPDRNPQHYVGKQVLKGRDAIRVGLTGPDMRCIGAVLEFLKIAGRKKRGRSEIKGLLDETGKTDIIKKITLQTNYT